MTTILENTNFSLTQTLNGYSIINNVIDQRLTNKTLIFDHANQLYKALEYTDTNVLNVDLNNINNTINAMRKAKDQNENNLFWICVNLLENN